MSGAIMISKSGVVLNPRRMDLSKIDDRFGDKVVLAKVAKLCGIKWLPASSGFRFFGLEITCTPVGYNCYRHCFALSIVLDVGLEYSAGNPTRRTKLQFQLIRCFARSLKTRRVNSIRGFMFAEIAEKCGTNDGPTSLSQFDDGWLHTCKKTSID